MCDFQISEKGRNVYFLLRLELCEKNGSKNFPLIPEGHAGAKKALDSIIGTINA